MFAPDVSRPMLQLEPETLKDTVSGKTISNLQKEQIKDDIRKWLSVDPLADKYPNISPYAYCGWNPINAIDPDGRDWYDSGEGKIVWDDNAISQEVMDQNGIKGLYLGKNILVGKHGRDVYLNENVNGAVFELYLENHKDGAIATISGNTIPCDVNMYGTLREGLYPAEYHEYHGMPAIIINGGGELPTVNGNPNNRKNYINNDKSNLMKPIAEHIMDQIYFHYGNNFSSNLKDSKGRPWSTGCQTGGNYKGSIDDYKAFMQNVPTTFNGWYYLRSK